MESRPPPKARRYAALALLEAFAGFSNAARPDFVLDLGDRISDENRETDLVLEQEVADAFQSPSKRTGSSHQRQS